MRQGYPDYVLDRWRDGRIAHRYEWTDGVRLIHTWFVQIEERFVEINADVHIIDPRDASSAETRLLDLERVLLPCVTLDGEAARRRE